MRAFIVQNKKTFYRIAAVLLALFTWQAVSAWVATDVLIASPVAVLQRLLALTQEKGFFRVLLLSAGHMLGGFLLALLTGSVLAALAGRFSTLEIFFKPFLATVKSVPVASFIVICLIWLTSGKLSIFISFLMALPIIYQNLLQGIHSTDPAMLACARVFAFSPLRGFLFVRLPAIKPFLLSACSTALGLAWKAGIAAEVIGVPDGSIGERLYYAKIYFDSADLFAWTVLIVLLSVGFEKLFLLLLKSGFTLLEKRL